MSGQRAEGLFHEARSIAGVEARAAFLERACGGDEALRRRVDALLAADREAGEFLRTADVDPDAAHTGGTAEAPGATVGRYRLLEELGAGGFGVVFRAEQTHPVSRQVALKVVKAGMDTRQVLARFEAERQALALMDHPNIATVLDAGATSAGRPYFVMELVRGAPITAHADDHKLTIRERLELFAPVCDAVQHAHQKGVIHRDIKPSNVLVSVGDRGATGATPKVIDFGIAKATRGRLTGETLFTARGQLVGTPQYMSPEQAETSEIDVDTRSDVYSLGVLLYELLTGSTPLDLEAVRRGGFAELRRMIRDAPTPRPSTRVWTLITLPDVAAQRRVEPRRLDRLLRGDLDWIVLKALEKDRARRYETADALAQDVRRHLRHEPVLAGPPGATYRCRKFVQRHRGPVAASVALLLLLVAGVVGTATGLAASMRANRALDEALKDTERQRRLAAANAAHATEVKRFIRGMLASVTPEEALGADTTLLERILDRTAGRLAAGEIDDPLIAAELDLVIGDAYRRLVLFEDADRHLTDALRRRELALGPADDGVLEALHALGVLRYQQGDLGEAERLFREVLERQDAVPDRAHGIAHRSELNLAQVLAATDRLEEAARLMSAYAEGEPGAERLDVESRLKLTMNLAGVYLRLGRAGEAIPLLAEALEAARARLAPDHPSVLHAGQSLAALHLSDGNATEARDLYRSVWDAQQRVLSPAHPQTLESLNGMAMAERELGHHEEAERLLLEGLGAHEQAYEAETETSLNMKHNLALVYRSLERPADAGRLLREVLSAERERRPGHSETLKTAGMLAMVLGELERYDEAEALYEATLRGQRDALPADHPDRCAILLKFGDMRRRQGRTADAEALFVGAIEGLERYFETGHASTFDALRDLAELYLETERPERAGTLLRERLARVRAVTGADSPETAEALALLARVETLTAAERVRP